MLQDTVEWFGDASTNVSVTVTTQSTPQVHWLITRLTLEEAASGARFAAQVGESFVESPHDGPELIGTTGRFLNKSVDLMGARCLTRPKTGAGYKLLQFDLASREQVC